MKTQDQQIKNKRYELFIMAISILSLVNVLIFFLPLDEEMHRVAEIYDIFLSLFLLGDFFYRFISAPDKSAYLIRGYGWLDFLGSLPLIGLRLLRLFRVVRAIRLIGRDGLKDLWRNFRQHRASVALLTVFFLILFSLEWASLAILIVEPDAAGANIKTASDALWWAYVSVTTVGYGDLYPVTNAGRVIGTILLAIGVGLFSVLTSYLARAFLSGRSERQAGDKPGGNADQLAEIQRLLAEQVKTNAELMERTRSIRNLPLDPLPLHNDEVQDRKIDYFLMKMLPFRFTTSPTRPDRHPAGSPTHPRCIPAQALHPGRAP